MWILSLLFNMGILLQFGCFQFTKNILITACNCQYINKSDLSWRKFLAVIHPADGGGINWNETEGFIGWAYSTTLQGQHIYSICRWSFLGLEHIAVFTAACPNDRCSFLGLGHIAVFPAVSPNDRWSFLGLGHIAVFTAVSPNDRCFFLGLGHIAVSLLSVHLAFNQLNEHSPSLSRTWHITVENELQPHPSMTIICKLKTKISRSRSIAGTHLIRIFYYFWLVCRMISDAVTVFLDIF